MVVNTVCKVWASCDTVVIRRLRQRYKVFHTLIVPKEPSYPFVSLMREGRTTVRPSGVLKASGVSGGVPLGGPSDRDPRERHGLRTAGRIVGDGQGGTARHTDRRGNEDDIDRA